MWWRRLSKYSLFTAQAHWDTLYLDCFLLNQNCPQLKLWVSIWYICICFYILKNTIIVVITVQKCCSQMSCRSEKFAFQQLQKKPWAPFCWTAVLVDWTLNVDDIGSVEMCRCELRCAMRLKSLISYTQNIFVICMNGKTNLVQFIIFL